VHLISNHASPHPASLRRSEWGVAGALPAEGVVLDLATRRSTISTSSLTRQSKIGVLTMKSDGRQPNESKRDRDI
jgi:hypothetical protein